jgi:hypothetical protein
MSGKFKWQTYEEVARQVLDDIRADLGIDLFEGPGGCAVEWM